MSCNCIEEMNTKLSEKIGKDCFINIEVLSGKVVINYFYDEINRNGKIVQKEGNMLPSYCPFCGKPYKSTPHPSEDEKCTFDE
jgi:hypothetical protein